MANNKFVKILLRVLKSLFYLIFFPFISLYRLFGKAFTIKNIFHWDVLFAPVYFYVCWIFIDLLVSQLGLVDPIEDTFKDFEITDLSYSKLHKNEEYRQTVNGSPELDTNVVLVNVGHLKREEIALLVDSINSYSPAAIGIDAMFRNPKEEDPSGDFKLVMSLMSAGNVVLVSEGVQNNDSIEIHQFHQINHSAEMFANSCKSGIANLITEHDQEYGAELANKLDTDLKICREFIPTGYNVSDSTEEHCFGAVLTSMYDSAATTEFLARKGPLETINYSGNIEYQPFARYRAYDYSNVFKGGKAIDNGKYMKGRIILLGFMGETLEEISGEDKFYTPLNERYVGRANKDMYGVVIHANIISMILERNYIERTNPIWGDILGIFLMMFIVVVYRPLYNDYKVWYDGVSKVIGIGISIILLIFVLFLYTEDSVKLSFPPFYYAIILLAGDLLEVYYGVVKNVGKKFITILTK